MGVRTLWRVSHLYNIYIRKGAVHASQYSYMSTTYVYGIKNTTRIIVFKISSFITLHQLDLITQLTGHAVFLPAPRLFPSQVFYIF